jgi:hypothetical protein
VQILFVFVERDNEEVGEPVANYFGIAGQETTVMSRAFCQLCVFSDIFFHIDIVYPHCQESNN